MIYKKKFDDMETQRRLIKDKMDNAEKQRISEQQSAQKLALENQKLKTELEKIRISSDEQERKTTLISEQLKNKLEQLEHDHEFNLRKLNEDKAEIKKQIKNAQKSGKTTTELDQQNNLSSSSILNEGKVSQEAVEKVTKEFNFELEKLRTEFEQQKKEKISVDASKRTLDLQLSSLRDQVEQEERARKKKLKFQKNLYN